MMDNNKLLGSISICLMARKKKLVDNVLRVPILENFKIFTINKGDENNIALFVEKKV